ncbi:MAG: hypothetical protein ACREAU_00180 [Nitrosopumilaceae archaeon]
MKVAEILYTDEEKDILEEAAKRAFRRRGTKLVPGYRCTAGPKAGRVVSTPTTCSHRKDPAKIRRGKKVMRQRGATIRRKSRLTKRRAVSKALVRINKRLSGR